MGNPDNASRIDASVPVCPRAAGWRTAAQVAVLAVVIGAANLLVVDSGDDGAGAAPQPMQPTQSGAGVPGTPAAAGDAAPGAPDATRTDSEIIKDETIPTWT